MAHKSKAPEESVPDSAPAAAGSADGEALRQEIQARAYYRYCGRGCTPGADVDDWLAAEQEVLAARAEEDPSLKRSAA